MLGLGISLVVIAVLRITAEGEDGGGGLPPANVLTLGGDPLTLGGDPLTLG